MGAQTMSVTGREFTVDSLLGKGKGGYSYLVHDEQCEYVLKQIHHESCSYYTFGDKIEAELRDYDTVRSVGIRIPSLIDCDRACERILKEYISGRTVYDYVLCGEDSAAYLQ